MGECTFDREGDAGDSGRRKGEVRGEPKDRGDGLYEGRMSCGGRNGQRLRSSDIVCLL